jgi:hypothetical protein
MDRRELILQAKYLSVHTVEREQWAAVSSQVFNLFLSTSIQNFRGLFVCRKLVQFAIFHIARQLTRAAFNLEFTSFAIP